MRIVVLLLALLLCASPHAAAPRADACAALRDQLPLLPRGPVLLASFPTADTGPLQQSAFLYDNAVAALALIGCGDVAGARRIGDALLIALDQDRFWHDGRLRNAYAAGAVKKGAPIKLSGWWDATQQRWLEDRYQVGSDNGNMAWAMLALLALERHSGDATYRQGAARIGAWVLSHRDARGVAGFSGGTFAHEPEPERIRWKSTEHNTDLAAAFALLQRREPAPRWQDAARIAAQFVAAMWDRQRNCFATGTGDDGATINPIIVLDAQIWPLLALPGATRQYPAALDCAQRYLAFEDGYAYSEVRDGLWTEGSAQALLLFELLGDDARAQVLRRAIEKQRESSGSYYASSKQRLPTGFMLATDPLQPRLYYRLPHLGALGWVALAEKKFNPFTGEFGLPE